MVKLAIRERLRLEGNGTLCWSLKRQRNSGISAIALASFSENYPCCWRTENLTQSEKHSSGFLPIGLPIGMSIGTLNLVALSNIRLGTTLFSAIEDNMNIAYVYIHIRILGSVRERIMKSNVSVLLENERWMIYRNPLYACTEAFYGTAQGGIAPNLNMPLRCQDGQVSESKAHVSALFASGLTCFSVWN